MTLRYEQFEYFKKGDCIWHSFQPAIALYSLFFVCFQSEIQKWNPSEVLVQICVLDVGTLQLKSTLQSNWNQG